MVGFRELVLSSVKVRWRRKETDNRLKEVLSFSSRSSFVTVMEASHFRDLDHPSKYRRLDRSRFRRIFIQCQMRARMQIVLKIRFQNPTQRTFVEHHNVIEAFAAYGADEALGVWILPRRSGSRQHFLNLSSLELADGMTLRKSSRDHGASSNPAVDGSLSGDLPSRATN